MAKPTSSHFSLDCDCPKCAAKTPEQKAQETIMADESFEITKALWACIVQNAKPKIISRTAIIDFLSTCIMNDIEKFEEKNKPLTSDLKRFYIEHWLSDLCFFVEQKSIRLTELN